MDSSVFPAASLSTCRGSINSAEKCQVYNRHNGPVIQSLEPVIVSSWEVEEIGGRPFIMAVDGCFERVTKRISWRLAFFQEPVTVRHATLPMASRMRAIHC